MAQYDLLLQQNVHATLVEYSEKFVHLDKGALLSADTSHVPTVLAAGTDGYYLKRDDAEVTGLKWVTAPGGCAISGTPADSYIAIWTGATAIEGTSALTYGSDKVTLTESYNGDVGFTISNTYSTAASSARALFNASSDAASIYMMATGSTYTLADFWGLAGEDNGILMASSNCSRMIIGYNISASTGNMYLCVGPSGTDYGTKNRIDFYYYTTNTMYIGIGAAASNTYKLYTYIDEASKWAGYFYNASSTGYGLLVKSGASSNIDIFKVENSASYYLSFSGTGILKMSTGIWPLDIISAGSTVDYTFTASVATTTGHGHKLWFYGDTSSDTLGVIYAVKDSATDAYGAIKFETSKGSISGDYDLIIDSTGNIFMPNIENVTNTNYCRYNSSTGEVTWLTSDARLKRNISDWNIDALTILSAFQPKEFIWTIGNDEDKDRVRLGWIAQDGVKFIPDMFPYVEKKELYSISEFEILPYFHKGITQLYNQTRDHESRIKVLEDELRILKSTIVT